MTPKISMWQGDDVISEDDESTWQPPTGPAAADPDPTDDREQAPEPEPPVVSLLAGPPPVVGTPWTVAAHTAAGVSGLVIEIEGRAHNVTMRPDPPAPNRPPTWSGTIDEIGLEPLRFRFAWRSGWAGAVTAWHTVEPLTQPTSGGGLP
jgi:hypothetical protein